MRVLELYLLRVFRTKKWLIVLFLIPFLFATFAVQQYKEDSIVAIAVENKDSLIEAVMIDLLEKQDVSVVRIDKWNEAVNTDKNLGIVISANSEEVFTSPHKLMVKIFQNNRGIASDSLDEKLDNISHIIENIANHSESYSEFEYQLNEILNKDSIQDVPFNTLTNPNSVVIFTLFQMAFFVMVLFQLITLLTFVNDKKHDTTRRILLTFRTKITYYAQVLLLYFVFGIIYMLSLMLYVRIVLGLQLFLSGIDASILILAYSLFAIISIAIGLLIIEFLHKSYVAKIVLYASSIIIIFVGVNLFSNILFQSKEYCIFGF